MKKFTLLCIMMLAVTIANAQYYYVPNVPAGQNPGGINNDPEFPVGTGLPADWTVILGPSNATPAWSPVQTLPFAFDFNGLPVTTYQVSSSGVLTFSGTVGTAPSYTNVALPNSAIPDNSVCIWGMYGTGTNDNIVTKTFGSAPNRQHWIFFNSYTGDNSTSWQYWSIVLEESSNKIYLVDQRFSGNASTLTAGIQINSTTAIQVAGSPSLGCNATTNSTPSDNTYYEFIYGTQPVYDLWVKSQNLYPIQLLTAAPYTISGKLMNLGSGTVNSLDLHYNINGGTVQTANITGLTLAPYANYTYVHSQPWTPAGPGLYTLKIWTGLINGNPDQNNNNDTLSLVINVTENSVQRLPLHEAFTSSTCGPCVAGNQNLAALFTANPNKWACVKYQMSWPGNGDPYYTLEGNDRRNVYGVNSVPQLWVDGGLGINTANYSQMQFNTAYNKPAFLNMSGTYSVVGHTVNIDISINPVTDILNTNLKLQVAIIENVTHNNVGGNGETEFRYVMKKMVPDANGTALSPLTGGTGVSQSFSYTFQGNYRLPLNALSPINHAIEHSVEDFNNLSVVAWIQDYKNREVFQSCLPTILVGSSEIGNPNGIVSLFPNPADNLVFLTYFLKESASVSYELYNLMGQKVFAGDEGKMQDGQQLLTIETNTLHDGLYIVQLRINDKVYTTKLNVTR